MSTSSHEATCAKLDPGRFLPPFVLVLCTSMLLATSAHGQPSHNQRRTSNPSTSDAYSARIRTLESTQGAYSYQLGEQLLGYGRALQVQGDHKQAVDVFKRAVHLARVNDGLYSQSQIPLVLAQISSLMSMRDYATADERQTYLHRIQTRVLDAGTERAQAYMQQANWHRSAYELAIGNNEGERLLNMRYLYRLAVTDIVNAEGEKSRSLLTPLLGLLRTQHLITRFEVGSYTGSGPFKSYSDDTEGMLIAAQSRTFKEGQAVIRAIQNIKNDEDPSNKARHVEALVQMGDWYLWNQKRRKAFEIYQTALAELATLDDTEALRRRLFDNPVALPVLDDLKFLPVEVSAEEADILLEFSVSARGKVSDIVQIKTAKEPKTEMRRLMRQLRAVPFRPRFDGNTPVDTEKVSKAFTIAVDKEDKHG